VKGISAGCGVRVEAGSESLLSSAGASMLLGTAAVSGLCRALSVALEPCQAGRAVHDPGKMVLDLAFAVALGGDCLADVAVVRAQPELFGSVASDATLSRLIEALVDHSFLGTRLRAARHPSCARRHGTASRDERLRRRPSVVMAAHPGDVRVRQLRFLTGGAVQVSAGLAG
jgi:hypothetical protein